MTTSTDLVRKAVRVGDDRCRGPTDVERQTKDAHGKAGARSLSDDIAGCYLRLLVHIDCVPL